MSQKPDIHRITLTALMGALVFVLTFVVKVPLMVSEGYIHLGDAGITFTALAFGPWVAAIAGGLGTALADVTGGFAQWAVFSLIVHGVQGWLLGRLFRSPDARASLIPAISASLLTVVTGYFIAGYILSGSASAIAEIPFNVIQVAAGSAVGVPLYFAARGAYPPLTRYRQN